MPWYLKVQSHFSRCHFFALLACTFPLCPTTSIQKPLGNKGNHPSNHLEASKKQPQATKGPQEITSIIHSLCFFLCHNLGILPQNLQWYSRIGVKFSPHQISPFQILHIPNFPLPSDCPVRGGVRHWISSDSSNRPLIKWQIVDVNPVTYGAGAVELLYIIQNDPSSKANFESALNTFGFTRGAAVTVATPVCVCRGLGMGGDRLCAGCGRACTQRPCPPPPPANRAWGRRAVGGA